MQVLPFVQVRDLPSSASFYSAITQPLKLRYISANSSSIVFGDTTYSASPDPVFEVRKASAGHRLTPSRLVLSAHSPSVVSAFRAAALRADPDVIISRDGESRIVISDFDGNKIEVACSSRSGYPTSYGGSTAVASDAGGVLTTTRDAYTSIRRSLTTSAVEAPPQPRESPRGLGSTGPGIGAVLGAAAVGVAVGGALTYTMMRNDRQRAPRQEYDAPRSAFYRRASAPDSQPNLRPRVETIYDPDEYATVSPRKYPPISYGGRYSQIDGPDRSRALEDIDDRASRRSGHTRSRRSSDAGSATRRPLMIADAEYRSNTPSKHGAAPKLLLDHEYRSQAGSKYTTTPSRHGNEDRHHRHSSSRASSRDRTPRPVPIDEATYVSARSKRSASTVRPAPAPERHHHHHHHGRSRASSYASARDHDGKSRDSWENWESDDLESLAPSDSISCAGGTQHTNRRSRQNPLPSGPGSFVGRYRKVVNEFDEKHRPLYGSEHY
ncbi:26S proteasome non-ATPase regulatory subunit [Hypoxylon texense]